MRLASERFYQFLKQDFCQTLCRTSETCRVSDLKSTYVKKKTVKLAYLLNFVFVFRHKVPFYQLSVRTIRRIILILIIG